jgi:branched-subunit amino acid aminotransferase/4-amino-4-deoxychorismate lyase
MKIMHNSKISPAEKPVISVQNQSFQFGYGVFETIKVMNGHPCFFDEHYYRLLRGCKILGLCVTFSKEVLLESACTIIKENKIFTGGIKVLYTRNDPDHDLVLMPRKVPYSSEDYRQGFSLGLSQLRRNPLSPFVSLKTTSYLENIYALTLSREKGFHDALFLNSDGFVSETSIANLFWVTKNTLYTPAESCGLLAGITRKHLLLLAIQLGLDVQEGSFSYEALVQADEVCMTNALIGIMPVCRIDERLFRVADYEVTEFLRKEYINVLAKESSEACS